MRDAEVEGAPDDRAARLERAVVPEVPPEAERDRGQLEPATPRSPVDHPVVALVGGDVRHARENSRDATGGRARARVCGRRHSGCAGSTIRSSAAERRRCRLVVTSSLMRRAVVGLCSRPPLLSVEAMDEGKHPLRHRPFLVRRLGRVVGRRHGSAIGETPLGRESRVDRRRRSACAPMSPAQCLESAPRLLCGACAEVGSEGRESRRSAACRSRATSDSGVSSYIVSASLAGPRRSATPVTTSVRRSVLMVTSIVSPVRIDLRGLYALAVHVHPPAKDGPGRRAPRLEHACRPEPLVDPHLIHGAMIAVAREAACRIEDRELGRRTGSDTVV